MAAARRGKRNAPTGGKRAKAADVRLRDPNLEREQARYEHPLPSREYVLDLLRAQGVPVQFEQLCKLLAVKAQEQEAFARRIGAMERDGQLLRNRRGAICVVEKLGLVRGRVQGHRDGFGFLIPDDGSPDLFLSPWEMTKVLHGDRVVVRETGVDRRGRREGAVVEVLERGNRTIVGRVAREHGIWFVVPEDKRIGQDILVPNEGRRGAQPGQVVVVELIEQPDRHVKPAGHVIEVLGNYADPGMEVEIALRKHELPHAFSKAAQVRASKLPADVRAQDAKGREDLRALPLVTIDGETAKDFDDAVYCEPMGKGFRLWVAIADVGHYVRDGDPLDRDARERGNSVYFPRRVIPMLPEALSNGLCSLNPEVDRLCVACEMAIDGHGAIARHRFVPAVMRSQARLTYTEVAEILRDPQAEVARRRKPLVAHLQALERVYHALAKARLGRGAIEFETIETRMSFDERGKISAIEPVARNDAHRIIEECMLAANVCASEFLSSHGHPMLYRIHEGPTPDKLAALKEFLRGFGLQLTGGDDPHAKDYARLMQRIKERPDAQLLQTVMLRSLQQAVYSPENVGHFGLAYESYTHFTSPIRRYPDLLVHRAIVAVLDGRQYGPGDWKALGEHCSATERRADEATRDVEAWLKCYYMQDKLGESFDGTVSGVAGFGIFVALDGAYVEGLVHVSELGNDYFRFDPVRHELAGERTRRRFRLADRVRVRVARVDLETARIDFVLDQA